MFSINQLVRTALQNTEIGGMTTGIELDQTQKTVVKVIDIPH